MEKELLKIHRETRTSNKGERDKATNGTRQKKKEHLARCNASYQPTTAGGASTAENLVRFSFRRLLNEGFPFERQSSQS